MVLHVQTGWTWTQTWLSIRSQRGSTSGFSIQVLQVSRYHRSIDISKRSPNCFTENGHKDEASGHCNKKCSTISTSRIHNMQTFMLHKWFILKSYPSPLINKDVWFLHNIWMTTIRELFHWKGKGKNYRYETKYLTFSTII